MVHEMLDVRSKQSIPRCGRSANHGLYLRGTLPTTTKQLLRRRLPSPSELLSFCIAIMTDSNRSSSSALFQVYLRLRPSANASSLYPTITSPERFLAVEPPETNSEHDLPTHITLNPPNDSRRRAVEKFAFTKVFEEHSSQLDLFHGTGIIELVEGVLGSTNCESRDGLLATLGVTGSGKVCLSHDLYAVEMKLTTGQSHTILGSKSQRGLTQLALDLLYRSIGPNLLTTQSSQSLHATVAASDHSEAQVLTAQMFMDMINGDIVGSRAGSRAPTPARVRPSHVPVSAYPSVTYPTLPLLGPASILGAVSSPSKLWAYTASKLLSYMSSTVSKETKSHNVDPKTDIQLKGESFMMPPPTPSRRGPLRPSVLPQLPDISSTSVDVDHNAEYAVVISMYEVYNDRIFDLLTPATKTAATKEYRRRPLLFKSTEQSADRKVVAGLRKIICGSVREALNVLEAGIHERRVAGTGSNTVSSRSHGFFCVEVKKRRRGRVTEAWNGNTMTIVDLAGSERARDAKTAGATLQEAGKINESLMYLGQCLQMQSDAGSSTKVYPSPHITSKKHTNIDTTAKSRPLSPMQTHRASLLKLLPIVHNHDAPASHAPTRNNDSNSRPTGRLQRNITNPPVLRSRPRNNRSTNPIRKHNHPRWPRQSSRLLGSPRSTERYRT